MNFQLKFTAREIEKFYALEAAGKPLPAAIQNAPDLSILSMPYWQAFNELSTSRDTGFGAGYIKYSEISDFLSENRIFILEERHLFRRMITLIDSIYISHQNKKNEKANASKPKSKPIKKR